ncbi:hypothetical protein BGZ79_004035, partial [Entomortierella chlamydospora]
MSRPQVYNALPRHWQIVLGLVWRLGRLRGAGNGLTLKGECRSRFGGVGALRWWSEWSNGRGQDQGQDQDQNQKWSQDQDQDPDQDWKPARLSERRKNFTLVLVGVDSPALSRVTEALGQDRDYQGCR